MPPEAATASSAFVRRGRGAGARRDRAAGTDNPPPRSKSSETSGRLAAAQSSAARMPASGPGKFSTVSGMTGRPKLEPAGSPLALRMSPSHCGCKPRDHARQDGAAADRAHRLVAAAHPPRQPAREQHAGYRRRRGTTDLRHCSTDSMTLPVGRYKAPIGQNIAGSAGHSENRMKVIGLAGWSGAGKTTLLARLIPYFNCRRPSRFRHQARPP